MKQSKRWQDKLSTLLIDGSMHSTEFAKQCMVFNTLAATADEQKDHVKEYSHDGVLKSDVKKFVDTVSEILNVSIIYSSYEYTNEEAVDEDGYHNNNYSTTILCNQTTYCKIVLTHETSNLSISCVTTEDDEALKHLHQYVNGELKPETSDGRVYVFSSSNSEPLISMGVASIPFEKENYSDEVAEEYAHIISDLNSISPSGRLVIIGGPPGTGKTFMIRALLNDVPDAMFIMLPADMVSSVMNPNLLTTLIRKKKSGNMAIIFIIEDADSVLVQRAGDNMNAISTILNMSSGIMGSMLDIRVIATTNAKKTEFDPAIVRSGRLSAQVDVGAISFDKAVLVLKRLLGDKYEKTIACNRAEFDKFSKKSSMILADVYDFARSIGWSTDTSDDSKKNRRKKNRKQFRALGF